MTISMANSSVSGMPEMEYVPCNLCGADDTTLLYEMPDIHFNKDHVFKAVQCRICGLGYVNPRPTQSAMDYYYPKEFYDSFDQNPSRQIARYDREADLVEKYAPTIQGRARRHLDIGCANGDFPRTLMKRKWDVEGIEIGSSAKKIKDFKVYNNLLPDIERDTAFYDAITAWAVLEHVHDPLKYFQKVSKILNPEGVFIFLVTNVDSISSTKLFREDLPRHTYFYNRRTVSGYLEMCGLELIEAIDHSDIFEMRPVGWLSYYINKLKGKPDLAWQDFPPMRNKWLEENNLSGGVLNTLRYSVKHPVAALDRFSLPVFEKWQMLTKKYGITTYIAQKPAS